MGTQLILRGLTGDSQPYNISAPKIVTDIHRAYVAAGAHVITANTFGAYSHKYPNAAELITAALQYARAAVNNAPDKWVALDIGPTGRLVEPLGDLPFNECINIFTEAARVGADNGADLILIETMTDLYELKAAVYAAKSTGLPVVATMAFEESGRTMTGVTPEVLAVMLEGLGVDALGMNCGLTPVLYRKLVTDLRAVTSLPILLQPNAGLPNVSTGELEYDITPHAFAEEMAYIASIGVNHMGGCCGTSPEHIAAMAKACAELAVPESPLTPVRICSGSQVAAVDGTISCVEGDDVDDLIDTAFDAMHEADILEIYLSNGKDIQELQTVIASPLALVAPSYDMLVEAVRLYNGRPLVRVTASAFSAEECAALVCLGAHILYL